jgi:polyisoprenyl-teichoic acid--peptidoglycan teichoic acid transferase
LVVTMSGSRRRLVGMSALLVLVLVLVTAVAAALVWQYGVLRQDGDSDARVGATPTPEPGVELTGPLNLLLVGVDTRLNQPAWSPNADAVLILHVPDSHDRAYLVSLPRDLLVDVPPFEPAGFSGQHTKLTHAMSYGSRVPGSAIPDPAQGLELLIRTVSAVTGIAEFDAAGVLNFAGFTDLVDAVGGVDIYLDQRVVSEHLQPDGTRRTLQPGGGGYLGPQKVYEVGEHHLVGWEALDVARQRNLDGADYARQRHHRVLVKALVQKLFAQDLVTDPAGIVRVQEALGDALVFTGRGGVVDFGFALRGVDAERIGSVGLPGASVWSDGRYLGEQLRPVSHDFLAALRDNRVEPFLADHPELLDPTAGGHR